MNAQIAALEAVLAEAKRLFDADYKGLNLWVSTHVFDGGQVSTRIENWGDVLAVANSSRKSFTPEDRTTSSLGYAIEGIVTLVGGKILEKPAKVAGKGIVAKLRGLVDDAFGKVKCAPSNTGKLVFDPATTSWKSPGGLVYGQGSAHGNRVKHVMDHLKPNPNKPLHSVFNVERNKLVGLIDDAWSRRGAGTLQGNRRVFEIDMGRVVGTNGETRMRLVITDGTTDVITAFPIP